MPADRITLEFSTAKRGSAKIRWLTRSAFSHVDVVIEGEGLLGASDSPKAPIIRGNPRGVAIRPFDYQEFGRRHRAVIKTHLAPYILGKLESQIDKPFDHAALYALFVPWLRDQHNWLDPEKWYCAELVVWAFDGIHGPHKKRFFPYELAIERNIVTPEDALLIFNPYFDVFAFRTGWNASPLEMNFHGNP
jgi:hypothetical protein